MDKPTVQQLLELADALKHMENLDCEANHNQFIIKAENRLFHLFKEYVEEFLNDT